MINYIKQKYEEYRALGKAFLMERAVWMGAGKPMRDPMKINELYNICHSNQCGKFQQNSCGICGCFLHPSRRYGNKLAWATTECPHENKYWEAEEGYKDVRIYQIDGLSNEKLESAKQEHEAEERQMKSDCGCGKR